MSEGIMSERIMSRNLQIYFAAGYMVDLPYDNTWLDQEELTELLKGQYTTGASVDKYDIYSSLVI